ncbi:MAG: glycosyltransferase family 4 protein [candidate division WOR-3 bacterium]
MSIKIIHILHHSPSWTSTNLEDDIFDGWHVRTAKAIQKLKINNCQIECWLPEKTYKKTLRIERNGLVYRIFPSEALSNTREFSLPMIKAIKQEKSTPILLHLHGIFNYLTYLITWKFGHLPIVVQHHGDCPPIMLLKLRPLLYSILPLLQLEQFLFCRSLKKIDHFFCLTKQIQLSLNRLGIKNKISLQSMGVEFDLFPEIERISARQKLNLPINSHIILYVGKLNTLKGGDKLIAVFKRLKQKYDITCVVVGASQSDEFFQLAQKNGIIIFPRQPHNSLNLFYHAADVYLYPCDKNIKFWSGIGISTLEAIACNCPVVSPTLSHFPNDYHRIGFFAENINEMVDAIEYVFLHPEQYHGIRKYALAYYDWSKIADNTYYIYQKLFKKYYNITLTKANDQ